MSARIKSSVGDNLPSPSARLEILDFLLFDMSIDISNNDHARQDLADGELDARFIEGSVVPCRTDGMLPIQTERERHTMSNNKSKKKCKARGKIEQNRPA